MRPVNQGQQGGWGEWWAQQPFVTKNLVAATLILTLAGNLGIIPIRYLLLFWSDVYRLQVWRLGTTFFVHGLGLPFLVDLFFLLRYGTSLETDLMAGRLSELVWMYMLLAGQLLLWSLLYTEWVVLGVPLVHAVVYVWSRLHPRVPMTFLFGVQFPSTYFPWVLAAFGLLQGASPLPYLAGILSGHVYYFGSVIVPKVYGVSPLAVPNWLIRAFPPRYNSNMPRAQQQQTANPRIPPRSAQAFQGQGYQLFD